MILQLIILLGMNFSLIISIITISVMLYQSMTQVAEKDKAAIRAVYLAKHPNAFWVT